jgi:ADP-ribosylglycohydrolase
MIGAIAGDMIGSPYEFRPIKTVHFPLWSEGSTYTDDSVLTVALAVTILSGTPYVENLKQYVEMFLNAGYGPKFLRWARSNVTEPYDSWGNGSAMRVSPVGWAFDSLDEVLAQAKNSADVTHNHPEGVKGAQATAAVIFLARNGSSKDEIRDYVRATFNYPLLATLDEIRPKYRFDVSCQGTVPPAIQALLESTDYEDAVRKAVSLGGDSDTLGCITGGMAQAFYGGVPDPIREQTFERLPETLREVVLEFCEEYDCY